MMNVRVKTAAAAEEIAAAIETSGVTMESILAALAQRQAGGAAPDADEDKHAGKTPIANQAQAEKAKPGVHRVRDSVGLYLRKGANGAGSWFRRYWFGGKRREMGLGALAKTTLVEARKKAREFDAQRDQGNDPLELRRATKAEASVKAIQAALAANEWSFVHATEHYLKAHAPSWKHPRARGVWVNPLIRYAYPVIGKMRLDDIRVQHVDAIMTAAVNGGAPLVAPRIRLRIEQILNAAAALGRRNAELPNPANVKLVKAIRPTRRKGEREHFRRLALADAPAAFRRLHALAQDSTPLAALVFIILTAARPSEALAARWDQIGSDKKVWRNPSSKTDKPLLVPLSALALATLERQAKVRTGDAIFPGRGGSSVSYAAFSAVARAVGFDLGSPHSWRSIFRDWASEHGGIARETAESALGHSLGAVERAYRRETGVEARAVAMQRYADWLMGAGAGVGAFPKRA
jgi:integrase